MFQSLIAWIRKYCLERSWVIAAYSSITLSQLYAYLCHTRLHFIADCWWLATKFTVGIWLEVCLSTLNSSHLNYLYGVHSFCLEDKEKMKSRKQLTFQKHWPAWCASLSHGSATPSTEVVGAAVQSPWRCRISAVDSLSVPSVLLDCVWKGNTGELLWILSLLSAWSKL